MAVNRTLEIILAIFYLSGLGTIYGQQRNGLNVCTLTKISYVAYEKTREACGWEWPTSAQCSVRRPVTRYKEMFIPVCCEQWVPVTKYDKDCSIAICLGRDGPEAGTCPNGGKCKYPDVCECTPGFHTNQCIDIDECSSGQHSCSDACNNTNGSYHCLCRDGYELLPDGWTCKPSCHGIEPLGTCLHDNECVFPDECVCADGFELPTCTDVNECDVNNGGCSQICTNTIGSYTCSCEDGYESGGGEYCEPICHGDNGMCPNGGSCMKPFYCSCMDGFQSPDCADIDECALEDYCDQTCVNTHGSYYCECMQGFLMVSDGLTCEDIDECGKNNGGCSELCKNSMGSYSCQCPRDYHLYIDGKTCKARCFENITIGSCPNGGTCLMPGVCQCSPGFQGNNCTDINECNSENGGCHHNCNNVIGSYSCSCAYGFKLISLHSCFDTDECAEGKHMCSHICVNQQGSYTCECPPGFTMAPDLFNCQDIDECQNTICNKVCTNTPGSFLCNCPDGFIQTANKQRCKEINLCKGSEEVDCWPLCSRNPNDNNCSCPPMMQIHGDSQHCIDPCYSEPCTHNGVCLAEWSGGHMCDCSGTGYIGTHCEEVLLEIPQRLRVRRGELHTDVSFKASPADTFVFHAVAEEGVAIYPNPIVIRHPDTEAKIGILAKERGLYTVTFNLNGDTAPNSLPRMIVRSDDVFSRLQLRNHTLPIGCFDLELNHFGSSFFFSSTSPWYRLKTDTRIYYTFGIGYFRRSDTFLPMGLQGHEIMFGTSWHISPVSTGRSVEHGILQTSRNKKDCEAVFLSQRDLDEFHEAGSVLLTLFQNIKRYLSYWFDMKLADINATSTDPILRSQILRGKQVKEDSSCSGSVAVDIDWYYVFWFSAGFYLDMLGQELLFPAASLGSEYCVYAEIEYWGTKIFHLVLTQDAADVFRNTEWVTFIFEQVGVVVFPRAVAVSFTGNLSMEYDPSDLTLYNGAGMFNYGFTRNVTLVSSVFIKKDLDEKRPKFKTDIAVEGFVLFYSGFDMSDVFTHIFVEARDFLLNVHKSELIVEYTVFGRKQRLYVENILEDNTAAVLAIGGKDDERSTCGRHSNPPGIFARARISTKILSEMSLSSPTIDLFILPSIDGYVFITHDDRTDKERGWSEEKVIVLLEVIKRRVDKIRRFIVRQKPAVKPITEAWIKLIVESMIADSDNILAIIASFNACNFSAVEFADFTRDIAIEIRHLQSTALVLQDRLSLTFDPFMAVSMSTLKAHLDLLHGHLKGLVWELYEGSITYFPKQQILGMHVTLSLAILGYSFNILAEVTISEDDLWICSPYYELYKRMGSISAVRSSGTVISYAKRKLQPWMATLCSFVTPEIGATIDFAMAKETKDFVAKIGIEWKHFGIRISTFMFVTSSGVTLTLEGNIFQIFRVRLTVDNEFGARIENWVLRLIGIFLPGGEHSFDDSVFDAVRSVIRQSNDSTLNRLKRAKEVLSLGEETLMKARHGIQEASDNLGAKQAAFDEAVNKLENAKLDIESAKKHFHSATQHLNNMQNRVDQICQIKICQSSNCAGGACILSTLICEMQNKGCQGVRGLAYAVLASVNIAVIQPMLLLDMAKGAVNLAQAIVDKSRVLLELAKGVYQYAATGVQLATSAINLTRKGLNTLASARAKIVQILNAVADKIGNVFDMRKCGFMTELTDKNWFELTTHCEINIMQRGWEQKEFAINFRDISGSLFGIAKENWEVTAETEEDRRAKRSASRANNQTNHILHDERMPTFDKWSERCRRYRPLLSFLNESVNVLRETVLNAEKNVRQLQQNTSVFRYNDDALPRISPVGMGIDVSLAQSEFNISQDAIEIALQETNFNDDQAIKQMRSLTEEYENDYERLVRAALDQRYVHVWKSKMERLTFPSNKCFTFHDCITWTFDEIWQLLHSVDPVLAVESKNDVFELSDQFVDLLGNDSRTLSQLHRIATKILALVDSMSSTNLLCATASTIYLQPSNITVEIGETAVFNCKAVGRPEPVYYWKKGDKILRSGKDITIFNLYNVSRLDKGTYSCMAGNHAANASSESVTLDVVFAPTIVGNLLRDVTILAGQNLSLRHNVSANPQASIAWHTTGGRPPISPRGHLDLSQLTEEVAALYHYTATNDYGMVQSSDVLVVVQSAVPACPVITIKLAYIVEPTPSDERQDLLLTDNPASADTLETMLQNAVSHILRRIGRFVHVKIASLSAEDHTVVVVLRPGDCHTRNRCLMADCVRHYHEQSRSMNRSIDEFRRTVLTEPALFRYNNATHLWNPAYFDIERFSATCPDALELKQPFFCVEENPVLKLDFPRRLKAGFDSHSVFLSWKIPPYESFVVDYGIAIHPHQGDPTHYLNTSSRQARFTFSRSVCGIECEVRVSALTAGHQSQWTAVLVDTNEKGEHSRIVMGISVIVGVLIVAVSVTVAAICCRKLTRKRAGLFTSYPSLSSAGAGHLATKSTPSSVDPQEPVVSSWWDRALSHSSSSLSQDKSSANSSPTTHQSADAKRSSR